MDPALTAAQSLATGATPLATHLATPIAAPGPGADPGLWHYLAQADGVGQTLFTLLLLMSLASWMIMATRGAGQWLAGRRSAAFLRAFWNAPSLQAVREHLQQQAPRDPFARLAAQALQAHDHHARHGAMRLQETGSAAEFLTRSLRQALDDEAVRQESGQTLLATIGATAPFVGLFGTVWGVFHALTAIGRAGAATLERVATPVGEALIMTGVGLAVALPAVVAYNAFVRAQRVRAARLDSFAHELFTMLATGEASGTAARSMTAAPHTPDTPDAPDAPDATRHTVSARRADRNPTAARPTEPHDEALPVEAPRRAGPAGTAGPVGRPQAA